MENVRKLELSVLEKNIIQANFYVMEASMRFWLSDEARQKVNTYNDNFKGVKPLWSWRNAAAGDGLTAGFYFLGVGLTIISPPRWDCCPNRRCMGGSRRITSCRIRNITVMKIFFIRILFFLLGTGLVYLFLFYPESIEQPLRWNALWKSMLIPLFVLSIGFIKQKKNKSKLVITIKILSISEHNYFDQTNKNILYILPSLS